VSWPENKSNRKNELYHEQELFMPFSKHSRLLFVGFVNHGWQLKQVEVIFIKIFLKTEQNFDKNHLKPNFYLHFGPKKEYLKFSLKWKKLYI
jgi:hypothetical protein